ncbi:chorismate mutase/prephenate dehydratase [Aspergillus steynii IBT 23096]|uniref:prephenate dehydratase n=1 Tax=Aspergillus steynii IBT 23096 TaxID=1392250 RepID=A0A2I2GFY8_9EURO|nr:chorismate mutase/prephenate dehydratase [Aspergillus steynii IBT 23096]PLB51792.1 chorismate mutase/prephenate dehydratase [Aspergillus steynii IBT 23096]
MALITVTFLGPAASFSHQAAVESFGTSVELLARPSFPDAFASVQHQEVDYAIVPFENSSNGSVVQTLDLLADPAGSYPDVRVCGEHYLSVHHCLLARHGQHDLNSINKLYTHPQAWGQCERFLSEHFKGVERQDVSSTSKAAEIVANETAERSAAIASRFAAEHHGLDIIEENIEDKDNNTTRFLVLRNQNSERTTRLPFEKVKVPPTPSPTARKTLISFTVHQNAPGALADALLIFKNHGMNLTSINSRPSQRTPWQYVFLVECQMAPAYDGKEAVAEILAGLKDATENSRHLGTWNSMGSSGAQ